MAIENPYHPFRNFVFTELVEQGRCWGCGIKPEAALWTALESATEIACRALKLRGGYCYQRTYEESLNWLCKAESVLRTVTTDLKIKSSLIQAQIKEADSAGEEARISFQGCIAASWHEWTRIQISNITGWVSIAGVKPEIFDDSDYYDSVKGLETRLQIESVRAQVILKSQAQPTNGAVREYSDWIGSPELIVMMTDNEIRGTGQNYEAESDRWANFRERIAERLGVAKEIIATCSKGVLPSSSHVYELKIGSGCADYSPEGRSDSTPCHIKNELGELGRVSQTAILDLAELSGCDVRRLLDEIPRGDSIEWSRLRRKCENANGSGYSPPLDKRGFIELRKRNGILENSDSEITRAKTELHAIEEPGSNWRRFRIPLNELRSRQWSYPSEWDQPAS